MPTFYFRIRDESGTVMKDEEGDDLADAAVARDRAMHIGRQFIDEDGSVDGPHLDNLESLAVEVRDRFDRVVCTVPLSESKRGRTKQRKSSVSQNIPWKEMTYN